MYARTLAEDESKVLTFGVSGKLWNRSLLMYDTDTKSLWSHILGTCEQGPHKGKKLTQIPCVITDWNNWQRQYPDSSVLMMKRKLPVYRNNFYNKLSRWVLGIAEGGQAKSWNFQTLSDQQLISDRWQGRAVVAVFERASNTARLYDCRLSGDVLTFRWQDGALIDDQTATRWDPATGIATDGIQRGKALTPLPAIVSFTHAWNTFHPNSENQ